jgi:hypothetical protein
MPWGLNVGVVGMLPYVALPTKLQTAVLPAIYPDPDEPAEKFARRVEAVMQARLDELTANRKSVLG